MTQDGLPTDDDVLVARAKAGDPDSFGELVLRHQDAVFRVVRRTSRVDEARAEDIAQEVFLRAYRSLDGFRGQCSFAHWLFRIATNLTINRVTTVAARAERRAISLEVPTRTRDREERMDPADEKARPPEAPLEREELKGALADALRRLPDDFRAAVVLRDVEGLDYEAIAEVLEVPIGTVRSRLHRGREALREIVTRLYGVPAMELDRGLG